MSRAMPKRFQGCAWGLRRVVPGSAGVLREDLASSPNDPLHPRSPLQLERYIQTSMKPEMVQLRQTAVQNQTATMLEIGSTLLNQSAEQSRKLTDVEAQVGGDRGAWHVCPPVPTSPEMVVGDTVSLLLEVRRFPEVMHGLMHRYAEVPGMCAREL